MPSKLSNVTKRISGTDGRELSSTGFVSSPLCSLDFRKTAFKLLPGLAKDRGFVLLLQHLLYSPRRPSRDDPSADVILICASTLSRFFGKYPQYTSRNYKSGEDLERFRDQVLPGFTWSRHYEGHCRTAEDAALPPELQAAWDRELLLSHDEREDLFDRGQLVRFADGEAVIDKKSHSRKRRNEQKKQALQATRLEAGATARSGNVLLDSQPPPALQLRLLAYMNGLPPNAFTKLMANMPGAYAEALRIVGANKQRATLRRLQRIQEQPQPFYGPTRERGTARIYERGETIANLKRKVRRKLTRGWSEFDLKAAQLAIVSQQWGLPTVRGLLEDTLRDPNAPSLWHILAEEMGLGSVTGTEDWSKLKRALKDATYALTYGSTSGNVKNGRSESHVGTSQPNRPGLAQRLVPFAATSTRGDDPAKLADLLLHHDALVELRRQRDAQIDAMIAGGSAEDCFGTSISVHNREDARSALARQAQAIELKLLEPALTLAEKEAEKDHADFRIVLWQHDGFSVKFRRQNDRNRLSRRIMKAVDNEARRLDIPTRLDVEHL